MDSSCGLKIVEASREFSFASNRTLSALSNLALDGWYFYPTGGKKVSGKQALHLPLEPRRGLIRLLSGPMFEGIGEETAKKIVTHGCRQVIQALEDKALDLTHELSVSENIQISLREGWDKEGEDRYLKLLLIELGLSNTSINYILDEHGVTIINPLIKKPYDLIGQVPRVTFEEIQSIVSRLNLSIEASEKIIAGIQFCLNRVEMQRGHTAAPIKRIRKDLEAHFAVDDAEFDAALCMENNHLVQAEYDGVQFVQSKESFDRDQEIVSRISSINKNSVRKSEVELEAELNLSAIEIELSDEQKEALKLALNSSVSVITGGPGTGKTSIVIALLKSLEARGKSITVCAPTGRAAKRLSETPGMEKYNPSTIHMMLARRTKEVDVLVIDEASMIDADLMTLVCSLLSNKSRLVLIGDVDQLPPVQAGQVFRDLIKSGQVPVGRLSKVFRQQSGSDIISAARSVISGEFPISGDGQTAKDFLFMEEVNEADLLDKIVHLYLQKLPTQLGIDPLRDIQILSPMRKGTLGIDNLNQTIQAILHGGKKAILNRKFGPDLFKGDKVIQTKNNYEKGIMNGDAGFVVGRKEDIVQLDFDGRKIDFSFDDLGSVQLAYAISIHKSQGSEYPAVIIPISKHHQHMLGRNLIYTAITRGRERVVVVGDKAALSSGIKAEWKDFRYSLLSHWLTIANNN